MLELFKNQASCEHSLHLPLPRLVETSFHGEAAELTALTDEALFAACGTRIAFTNRHGGVSEGPYASLNLGDHVEDDLSAVERNRRIVLDAFSQGRPAKTLIVPKQVHGSDIVVVDDVERARQAARAGADGVVCASDDVAVLLCFADCVPVIAVAPDGAFTVAHAGWRGAIAGIPQLAVEALARLSGCETAECNAYIGPHIGACCYEVSDELLQRFVETFGPACAVDGKLDLSAAVAQSLRCAGVAGERIADAGICTSCNVGDYYSYRAEGGVCGRHGAYAQKGSVATWD